MRVVEVDRLLDEREAEPVAIEVERPLRVGADARDVVQARQLHDAESTARYLSRRKSRIVFTKNSTATSERQPRQVPLDDVRPALRLRREAHAAHAGVAARVHEDQAARARPRAGRG